MTAYGWDVDNKTGYDYTTANPIISYNALISVLGVGTHTMTFMVTDSHGGVATAQTTVTVAAPEVRMFNNTSRTYTTTRTCRPPIPLLLTTPSSISRQARLSADSWQTNL